MDSVSLANLINRFRKLMTRLTGVVRETLCHTISGP
jgi:hypothetical protein